MGFSAPVYRRLKGSCNVVFFDLKDIVNFQVRHIIVDYFAFVLSAVIMIRVQRGISSNEIRTELSNHRFEVRNLSQF